MFSGEDAFDVFDESNTEDFSTYEQQPVAFLSKKRKDSSDGTNGIKKKQATGGATITEIPDLTDAEDTNAPQEKKANEPLPVVTDSFEQDLEREVASAAGLMPSAEGANVVLSHSVNNNNVYRH